MNDSFKREPIGDGVWFSQVIDPKFKHNRITANLLLPLDRAAVTENALVPFLLRRGCRRLPDFTELNRKLCMLYGASLSCDVSRYGAYQSLDLSIYGIDDRFTLDGERMIGECAALLADVLLDPKLEGGLFGEEDVALERQQLCDTIEGLVNDKRLYAMSRCRAVMCEGEPFSVEKYGYLEEARALTPAGATAAWRRALETAQIELSFVGCGDPAPAKELFREAFGRLQSRNPVAFRRCYGRAKAETVREVTDEMDVAQSKLVLGFRTGGEKDRRQLAAMRMMSALYGGTPNSKLFLNVREKLSLCYYCAARFDRLTGLMMVDSGVEKPNRQKAQDEILRQLECVKRGEFTDDEVDATLLLMQNSLRSVGDSLGSLEDWYLTQTLCGSSDSPADESALLAQVTREEIIEAANRVTLDTVYFLTGKEAE